MRRESSVNKPATTARVVGFARRDEIATSPPTWRTIRAGQIHGGVHDGQTVVAERRIAVQGDVRQ